MSNPCKRRKTGAGQTAASNSAPYLTCFDTWHPIVILVSARRNSQAAIWARNLAQQGACIVSDLHPAALHNTDLLVITDNRPQAATRIEAQPLHLRSVRFVSTRWACAVLSARRWLPFQSYLIPDEDERVSAPAVAHVDVENNQLAPVWSTRALQTGPDLRRFFACMPQFICERCTITQAIFPSPNRDLCDILQTLALNRQLEGADISARAYRIASATLKCIPVKLSTLDDARALHSFGPTLVALLNEFLSTGAVQQATLMHSDPRLATLRRFHAMYAVGPALAKHFYDNRAIKTVADLERHVEQRPAAFPPLLVRYLKHYNQLHSPTLRQARRIRQLVDDIANDDQQNLHLRFVLCGGFRRGEPSGHDVDLLYCRTNPFQTDHSSVMHHLLEKLHQRRVIVQVLRNHSNRDGSKEPHYHQQPIQTRFPYAHDVLHAIAHYDDIKFRLDIVGVRDATEFCFATLAWSGSTAFQRDLRLFCEKRHNWIFNHHGLFHRQSGNRVELNPQPQSEHDIFAALQLTYRAPFERSA